MINTFYSVKELARESGISESFIRTEIENGNLLPVYFGVNKGKCKISIIEYNRWSLHLQYKDNHEKLLNGKELLSIVNGID